MELAELVNLPPGYELQVRQEGWGWTVSLQVIITWGAVEFKITKFKVFDLIVERGISRVMRGLR